MSIRTPMLCLVLAAVTVTTACGGSEGSGESRTGNDVETAVYEQALVRTEFAADGRAISTVLAFDERTILATQEGTLGRSDALFALIDEAPHAVRYEPSLDRESASWGAYKNWVLRQPNETLYLPAGGGGSQCCACGDCCQEPSGRYCCVTCVPAPN